MHRIDRFGLVNGWLVEEEDGVTLIDTLLPGSAKAVLAAAEPLGAPIRRIALTHAHGDRVGSLEVIAAPGHTPGHVAFLDVRDRTLYCGDAYTTLGGVRTTAKRLTLPFPLASMATWDGPTELASAKALRALEPARLAPGHGRVVEDPLAGMDAAIAKGA